DDLMVVFVIPKNVNGIYGELPAGQDNPEPAFGLAVDMHPLINQFLAGQLVDKADEAARLEIAGFIASFHIIEFFEHLNGNGYIMLLEIIEGIVVVEDHGCI